MEIGIAYAVGTNELRRSVGADRETPGERRTWEIVVADANRRGGLGGHRIEPVWFEWDQNSRQPVAQQMQAACATFTEDHDVFAVAFGFGFTEPLRSCLADHGTPLVAPQSNAVTANRDVMQRNPGYFEFGPSLERFVPLYVDGLLKQGYLSGRWDAASHCQTASKPKLGLVAEDTPERRDAYERLLAPAFAARGHPIEEVAFFGGEGAFTDQIAQWTAQLQSIVLRFSSECVDHVVFLSTGSSTLFMVEANNQNYTPRYGLASQNCTTLQMSLFSNPGAQLRGSVGVGWTPYCDVHPAQFDDAAKRPSTDCLATLAEGGIEPTGQSASRPLWSCDGIYFLQRALEGTSTLTRESLIGGVDRLGDEFVPAGTYRNHFSSGRHDGASAYRTYAFDGACSCFKYRSPLHPF